MRGGPGRDTLVAISSRSWQGGCDGSDATGHAAVGTRLEEFGLRTRDGAEIGDAGACAGMLRARSGTAHGREPFTLVLRSGQDHALKATANGK
ncbi:hypothetical protein ACWC4D_03500 [Streptomyces sp. NPDC001288]|uniref:hypothetical protein n=1 Tax=unclassified Streptomyces TaxID=2593676 RepID=UPI003323262F